MENPFEDNNYEINIRSGFNQSSYITIKPIINTDCTYNLILTDYTLSEINKALDGLFKKRITSRNRINNNDSKISLRIGEFELNPIYNFD